MRNNTQRQPNITAERRRKIKQAEAAFDQLIRGSSTAASPARTQQKPQQKSQVPAGKTELKDLLVTMLILVGIMLLVGILLYTLWRFARPVGLVLVVMLCLALPGLCKGYGIIVGGFTMFSGIRLGFSAGQSFSALPIAPFYIIDPSLSYFCLSWGLLVASRQTRSTFGFTLGLLNLLGGVFGLFYIKVSRSTQIVAPGYWGSIISGLYMVGLGASTIKTISQSWTDPEKDEKPE